MAQLVPVFWAFEDDWIPGSQDNARTDALVFTTLLLQWTRSMMLGQSASLQLPVPMPPEVREYYSHLVARVVSEEVGRSLHPPVVGNP